MNSKPTFKRHLAWGCALIALTTSLSGAPTPRQDINPALLYWQALAVLPDLSEADRKTLSADWTQRTPSPEDTALARRFDIPFKVFRRAAQMRAPCDWGMDPVDGPAAILPNLAKIRSTHYAAMLRARLALDEGRALEAVDDLLAVVRLARRSADDGSLVQAMLQISNEGAVVQFFAGTFHLFPSAAAEAFVDGLESEPARITVAQGITGERVLFYEWLVNRALEIQATKNDAEAAKQWRRLFTDVLDNHDADAARIFQAAGGTSAGLVAYIKEIAPVYDKMAAVATASESSMFEHSEAFQQYLSTNTNLLANMLVPNIIKARWKELEHLARVAMLRAAILYRASGEAGLKQVQDPFGKGPFEMEQSSMGNGREQVTLRSRLAGPNLKPFLTFIEKSR